MLPWRPSAAHDPLTLLSILHGTDKWGSHWYTPHYHAYLKRFRRHPINLLEIGVGGFEAADSGGHSLRVWRDYFSKARIFGVDIHAKSLDLGPRVSIERGSQDDPSFLTQMSERAGGFDVVIDDGSHVSAHVIHSFQTLFPLLRAGGVYIVEDLQTSYWPDWGGDSTNLTRTDTSMGFFKSLLDGLNHAEIIRPGVSPSYFDTHITGMHFHHNLVVIEKGQNTRPSNYLVDNREPEVSPWA